MSTGGSNMAANAVTPMDAITGIPLPIFPRTDLPPIPTGKARNTERIADWHHPFHPRLMLVSAGMGAVAVRNCRIQWAQYGDHHNRYHGAFLGPELPGDETEQFRTVVLAAAGYIPEEAIGFERNKPIMRQLTEDQRDFLWRSRQIRVANAACVRDFLLEYAIERNLHGIHTNRIDEFLHTNDPERKRQLGSTFLGIAAYAASEPVSFIYRQSRQKHLLPPHQPRSAGRFVLGAMTVHRGTRALAALTAHLAA